jgi:hypothetical protein
MVLSVLFLPYKSHGTIFFLFPPEPIGVKSCKFVIWQERREEHSLIHISTWFLCSHFFLVRWTQLLFADNTTMSVMLDSAPTLHWYPIFPPTCHPEYILVDCLTEKFVSWRKNVGILFLWDYILPKISLNESAQWCVMQRFPTWILLCGKGWCRVFIFCGIRFLWQCIL